VETFIYIFLILVKQDCDIFGVITTSYSYLLSVEQFYEHENISWIVNTRRLQRIHENI